MKHFTLELYLRFNSPNRAEVANAHDEWEEAIRSYRQYLKKISPKMTATVRALADSLCLHDAHYLGIAVVPVPDDGKSLAVLLTREDSMRIFLVYFLAEQPLTQQVSGSWPYSKEQVHWLYDEFDVDEGGVQQHEVLLSNGQLVTLRFHDMQIIKHDIQEPALASQT
jgi:hypothetical protein